MEHGNNCVNHKQVYIHDCALKWYRKSLARQLFRLRKFAGVLNAHDEAMLTFIYEVLSMNRADEFMSFFGTDITGQKTPLQAFRDALAEERDLDSRLRMEGPTLEFEGMEDMPTDYKLMMIKQLQQSVDHDRTFGSSPEGGEEIDFSSFDRQPSEPDPQPS